MLHAHLVQLTLLCVWVEGMQPLELNILYCLQSKIKYSKLGGHRVEVRNICMQYIMPNSHSVWDNWSLLMGELIGELI